MGKVKITVGCQFHKAQHRPGALGNQLPGHQVAVVLHHREHDLVTRPEIGHPPTVGHQINRFAGIAGKDNFAITRGINKTGNLGARRFVGIGCLLAKGMRTPMHIGIRGMVVLLHRIQHCCRFLGCGGIIEIDQR